MDVKIQKQIFFLMLNSLKNILIQIKYKKFNFNLILDNNFSLFELIYHSHNKNQKNQNA